MKRITWWVLSTVSVLVLLFGYHTSTAGAGATSSPTSVYSSGTLGSTTSGTSSAAPSASAPSTSKAKRARSVTGEVAQTRWGPVQVKLNINSGKITGIAVVQYPSGNGKDDEINSYALPILIKETQNAQSANIDMVSGATVTSDGYVQSLQSALDKAGL